MPLTLTLGKPDANRRVPVALQLPDGTSVQGDLDLTAFQGDWSADTIAGKLNDTANRQQAESLGKGLFTRLFSAGSPLRAAWDGVTLEPGIPLEMVIECEELRAYPWELLWDDLNRKVARRAGLLRRTTGAARPPASSEWPFRVLIIVGVNDEAADPQDRIGAQAEVQALRRTLVEFGRSLDIHVLDRPTHDTLRDELEAFKPHVIHFIGHGFHDAGIDRHCLVIEDEKSTWNWTTDGIAEDLANGGCTPRLVFLNCCRSAGERQSTSSLQSAASDFGVPIVVAMQADVRGDQAALFSRTFYQHALIEPNAAGAAGTMPLPVTDAMRRACLAIGGEQDIAWGLPTLTLCRDVPIDCAIMKWPDWPDDKDFLNCREFDAARVYADAQSPRRRMVQWCYPIVQPARPTPNVLILRGPAQSGKTRLLHWCMESWATKPHQQRYLDVSQRRGENCLKWLMRIRAGTMSVSEPEANKDRLLKQPLPLAPFLPFYTAVAKAANLLAPGQDAASLVSALDQFAYTIADDVQVGPLFEAFLDGLTKMDPVVLVFDQVTTSAITPGLFDAFRDEFLARIGNRTDSNVRVVLATTSGDFDQFTLKGLKPAAVRVIDIETGYSNDQLEELAVEALRYRAEAKLRPLARGFLALGVNGTGLGQLHFCESFLKSKEFSDFERMK